MIWARLICVAIVAAVAAFVRWVPGFFTDQNLVVMFMLLPLPFAAAALLTLALSFFRTERSDGRLLISRNNTFLRIVSKFMDPGQKVTVCALFWSTGAMIMAASVLLAIVGFFGWGIYKIITGDTPHYKPITAKDVIAMIGFVVAAGIVLFGVVTKERAATRSQEWLAWGIIATGFMLLLSVGFFFVPLWEIAEESKVSLFGALPAYWELFKKNALPILAALGIFIGGLAAMAGTIFGLFRGIKALRKSLIGRILEEGWQAFKTRTCPIVSVIEGESPKTPAPEADSQT